MSYGVSTEDCEGSGYNCEHSKNGMECDQPATVRLSYELEDHDMEIPGFLCAKHFAEWEKEWEAYKW